MSEGLSEELLESLINSQRNELTEHIIHDRLARSAKDEKNRSVLKHLSEDELGHYRVWEKITHAEPSHKPFKVWRHLLISRLLGLTFALKLMERGEEGASSCKMRVVYRCICSMVP